MNDDDFKDLAVQAGFEMALCGDGKERLAGPIDNDPIEKELFELKRLLLDKVLERSVKLIKYQTRFGAELNPLDTSYNEAVADIVQIIEKMK